MPRPSEKYKHAVKSKQHRAGGGGSKRSAKPRPGAKKRPTAGQSKAANKLKGGNANSTKMKKKSNQGNKSRGNKKALPKRVEKKKVVKQTFFGKLKRRFCATVDTDINLSETAQRYADSIGLQQSELRKLCMIFSMIDYDESGEIDADEFMEFINEKKTPFTQHIFNLIDEDGSGEVDQNEFIGMMCIYCMYTKEQILRFTFDSFDDDKSGALDEEEFLEVAKSVNDASPMFPGNFQTALEEFDQNDDGLIDFDEFNILNRRYPLVLFPAFRLQDNMQKATLGAEGWTKVGRRVFKANYIAEYMKVHGGEVPQETFFKKLSNCFQPTIEVQMAHRITQQGEFDDSKGSKKKRRKRRS
jgi:Ca2+-binding EF-hand superfamily protein